MSFLIRLLGGAAGPYIAGALAAALALSMGAAAVQTKRLDHAKAGLQTARAALKNPATGKTWQSEAIRDAAGLKTCRASVSNLEGSITRQNGAVDAMKAESDARSAMLSEALQAARKAASAANAHADRILAIDPTGAGVCERLIDVDRQIMGASR